MINSIDTDQTPQILMESYKAYSKQFATKKFIFTPTVREIYITAISHMTSKCKESKENPSKMIEKLETTLSTAQQNRDQTQNPHQVCNSVKQCLISFFMLNNEKRRFEIRNT